jgi:PIN domain nuclease of toxin-antitoxin system
LIADRREAAKKGIGRMTAILYASALLAYWMDQPGSDVVDGVLAESFMSSVNWAEVVKKSIAAGVDVDDIRADLQSLGLTIERSLQRMGKRRDVCGRKREALACRWETEPV